MLGAAAGVAAPALAGSTAAAAAATRDSTRLTATGVTSPRNKRGDVAPGNRAARLKTLPTQTQQVVIVGGSGYSATYATLETYAKQRGRWWPVSGPMPARIGSKGFSDNHTEGVPTTPTGVYSIGPTMYGNAPDPGVRYPYHRLVSGDWWNENPASPLYNSFQHSATDPGGYSEALWREVPAYTHFAVITYNMAPNVPAPVPNAGSGIFLHEFSTGGGNATAGCVAVSHSNLVAILRWLDPALSPRIVISPYANLDRY